MTQNLSLVRLSGVAALCAAVGYESARDVAYDEETADALNDEAEGSAQDYSCAVEDANYQEFGS